MRDNRLCKGNIMAILYDLAEDKLEGAEQSDNGGTQG